MGGRSPIPSGVHPGLPASHAHHPDTDATSFVSETFAALLHDYKDKSAASGLDSGDVNAKFQAKLLATSKERKVLEELYSNDGLAPGIFKFLWLWKGTGSDNQSVHIPQTVIFLNGTPVAWYFWSKKAKKVLRKQGGNIDTGKITEAFSATTGESPVVATYQQQEHFSHDSNSDVQQAPRALSQVQYLNEAELGALLAKGIRHRGVGVLQKFVVPADKRCTTVCATWSPQNCVVQRRTNKYRLMDSAQEVQRRLVTWDGPELLSETMPLSGTVITKRVETFCKEFVEHAFSASGGRYRIYRMSANFRVAADNSLHFLGATSLRLLDAGEQAGAMSLAISRAERGEREPPGPLPTTGVMTSTVRFDGSSSGSRPSSAKNATAGSRPASATGKLKYTPPLHIGGRLYSSDSLPSPGRLLAATAVGFAHSNVNKPRPDDQFVCVLTGKVCSNRELYEVSYLKLIKYWEWELRYKSAEEKAAAEHQVPPYIQRAQPAISTHWYLSARNNPKWTARMAAVCEQAAADINNALQGLRRTSSSDGSLKYSSHQVFRSSASQLAHSEALAAAAAGSPPGSAGMGHWRRPAPGTIGSWPRRPGSAHLAASASELASPGQSSCFALPSGSMISRPQSGSSSVSKALATAVPAQPAAAAAAEMTAASDVTSEWQQEAAPQQQGDSPGGAEQATDDAGAAASAEYGLFSDGAEQQVLLQEPMIKEGELQQDAPADAAASSTEAAADNTQGISLDAPGPDHVVIKEGSVSMQPEGTAPADAGDAPELASGGHAPEASADGAPGNDAQAVPCEAGDVAAGTCDSEAAGMQVIAEAPASEPASEPAEAAEGEGAAAAGAAAPETAAAEARPAAAAIKKTTPSPSAVTTQQQKLQKQQVGHRILGGHSRKAASPAAKQQQQQQQQQPKAVPEPARLTMKDHIKQACAVYGVHSSKPAGKKAKSKKDL